tara:strand:+ start:34 stop:303 length:270 start_codon:yes stop_codon:yes gene_type:complete
MWCFIQVVFLLLEDFETFIVGDFGDMDVDKSNLSVMCTGNHRLLTDVHSWCECVSEGDVTTLENFDGYDTTTVYKEGEMISQESVEEDA